jgi:hypothetical protein
MMTSVKRCMSAGGPAKLTLRLFAVRPVEFRAILLGGRIDQHPLHAAHHALTDRALLQIKLRLQAREPLELDFVRDLVGQGRRRRTRTAAVDEAEGLIEAHIAHQIEASPENRARSRRESR